MNLNKLHLSKGKKVGKNLLVLMVIIFCAFFFITCSNKKGGEEQLKENLNTNNGVFQPDVKVINASQLKNIIENRFGRTLFVNVWATWSEPSIKEIPDIQKLYDRYKDQVDFLSLTVDLSSKIDSVIVPFLKQEEFKLPVYVVDENSGIKIMKMLSPKWNGGIPASFIFDKNGKREIFILGRQTFDNISKGIDSVNVL